MTGTCVDCGASVEVLPTGELRGGHAPECEDRRRRRREYLRRRDRLQLTRRAA